MPCWGRVGRIVETRKSTRELLIEWQIRDFFSLSGEGDRYYESRYFSFYNGCYCLRVWPSWKATPKWVTFCLDRNDSGPPKTIMIRVGIRGSGGVEVKREEEREFSNDSSWCLDEFCSRSELWNQKLRLMPDGILTITLEMTNVAPSAAEGLEELQKSLQRLLQSGEDCDVLLKVQGKEFSAHRAILRARSPVFQAMFTHDMVEKQNGVVKMEDCDSESFSDFLEHVYTCSVDMISLSNVFSLYSASDKYDLRTLKKECTEFMKQNLTVSSFCNTITLAMKHNDKNLIERATTFFCDNSLKIVETADWQTFLRENSTVGNELFIKTIRRYQNT